ncbi:hypothetical protein ACFL6T_00375 [Candidatus Zixiibacteriota bacterium]
MEESKGTTETSTRPGVGPSAGLAFGVALVSLLISGVLFFQMQSLQGRMKRELEENTFQLHRTGALLEALGISLEPGSEYEGLELTWPPESPVSEAARALDQSKTAVALGQLRNIQTAFLMRMTGNDLPGYPTSTEIRSYTDLREVLADFAYLPTDPLEKGWVFLGYLRPARDSFVLLTEARNRERTLITVTPEQITPWHVTP